MSFARYTAQRLAWTAVLFGLVCCSCFLMLNFVPGSFFDEMRLDPRVSSSAVDALREAHGLSKPALARFAAWLLGAVHGDLGMSFASNQPVLKLLLPRLSHTLLLTVPAGLLAWIVGLWLGIWAAAVRFSVFDKTANFFSTVLNTVPEVVLCCIVLLAASRSHLLPAGGMTSPLAHGQSGAQTFADLLRHMVLPVFVLTAVAVPPVFCHTRAAMLDVFESPFIRSARAHGIPRLSLLCRHVLPVAANSLISLAGVSLGCLFSASLVTEVLFAWPGVGPLFLDAVSARDPYVIIAAVLCFSAMLIGGNLLADLALHYRDPRLRIAG